MAERYELRFSGAGGQGLITAGIILAEAASIIEGKHLLAKFVELSRYFDPNTQIQDIVKYKRNVADAQEIF